MSIELVAAWWVGAVLAIVGLSHIVAPRAWCDLFRDLNGLPYGGVAFGLFTLLPGLAVALAHNSWELGWRLPVTLIGWAWVVKGASYMLVPGQLRRVSQRHLEHPWRMAAGGAIGVVLGGFIMAALAMDAGSPS
jgi:uncharacterized protein YjeT (DUF2065 family)